MRLNRQRLFVGQAISLFYILAFCNLTVAQDIRVDAHVEWRPYSYHIGDPINYRVSVFAPEQARVVIPQPPRFGEFEILHRFPPQREKGELQGWSVTIAEWQIALYRTGKATIPPLAVQCELEGRTTLARTNPVDIEIVPITKPDDKDPRPIRPPMPYPLNPVAMAIVLVASLLAMMMFWAVGRVMLLAAQTAWSQFQKVTTKPPLPPHLLALQTIDRAEQLYRQGEVERAFVLLSFGVRRYLRDRFNVAALELPTTVLTQQLYEHLPTERLQTLRMTLNLSDIIKFARYTPKDSEAYQLFTNARQIVHTIAPQQDEKL